MIFFQAAPPVPVVGDRAPDVVFRRADGSRLRLSSLQGGIVVLEFTSLNCPPCREIAPKLEEMAAKQPEVVFLTISVDAPDATAKLLTMRPKNAKTLFAADPYDRDRSKMCVWKFGNVGTPTMFVIDSKGRFASRAIQGGAEVVPHITFRIAWAKSHTSPDVHAFRPRGSLTSFVKDLKHSGLKT